MSKKQRNNKEKGNSFERIVAKELSIWLFGEENKNLLRRSADSGAQKVNYTGDVIPEGQLPIEWNAHWTFEIETKYGYKNIAIPTVWNKEWLTKWFLKSREESKIHNQQIVLIINNFLNRKYNTITTDIMLNPEFILHEMSYPIVVNGYVKHLFIYNYKKVLQFKHTDLFPNFYEVYCPK